MAKKWFDRSGKWIIAPGCYVRADRMGLHYFGWVQRVSSSGEVSIRDEETRMRFARVEDITVKKISSPAAKRARVRASGNEMQVKAVSQKAHSNARRRFA